MTHNAWHVTGDTWHVTSNEFFPFSKSAKNGQKGHNKPKHEKVPKSNKKYKKC